MGFPTTRKFLSKLIDIHKSIKSIERVIKIASSTEYGARNHLSEQASFDVEIVLAQISFDKLLPTTLGQHSDEIVEDKRHEYAGQGINCECIELSLYISSIFCTRTVIT